MALSHPRFSIVGSRAPINWGFFGLLVTSKEWTFCGVVVAMAKFPASNRIQRMNCFVLGYAGWCDYYCLVRLDLGTSALWTRAVGRRTSKAVHTILFLPRLTIGLTGELTLGSDVSTLALWLSQRKLGLTKQRGRLFLGLGILGMIQAGKPSNRTLSEAGYLSLYSGRVIQSLLCSKWSPCSESLHGAGVWRTGYIARKRKANGWRAIRLEKSLHGAGGNTRLGKVTRIRQLACGDHLMCGGFQASSHGPISARVVCCALHKRSLSRA